MQRAAHHLIHKLELRPLPQLNPVLFQNGRDNKLQEDLVVEVFDQQQGIVLVFFKLQTTGPVDIQNREDDGTHKDNDQAGNGKILDQPERFNRFTFSG